MKTVTITGKTAFLFVLIVIMLLFSFSSTAVDYAKQAVANIVGNGNSIDANNNGIVDRTEYARNVPFSGTGINRVCSDGFLSSITECNSKTTIEQKIKDNCVQKSTKFGYDGLKYLACPEGMELMNYETRAENRRTYIGTILCC